MMLGSHGNIIEMSLKLQWTPQSMVSRKIPKFYPKKTNASDEENVFVLILMDAMGLAKKNSLLLVKRLKLLRIIKVSMFLFFDDGVFLQALLMQD